MAKSQFTKSLGRELGKNTGRVISNGLFGDKHSSKSTHIIKGRLEARKAEAKAELDIAEQKIKQENQAIERAQVDNISEITLSSNENELANQLNQIISLISGQNSRKVKKSGIEKIEFGISQFKSPIQQNFFNSKLKRIKFIFNLPYYFISTSIGLLILGLIIGPNYVGELMVVIGGVGSFVSLLIIVNYYSKQ